MPDPDTISADYTLRPSELAATLALLVEARQPVIAGMGTAPGSRQERRRPAGRRRRRPPVCRRPGAPARPRGPARHPVARQRRPHPLGAAGLPAAHRRSRPLAHQSGGAAVGGADGASGALSVGAGPQGRRIRAARGRLADRLRQPGVRSRGGAPHADAIGIALRPSGDQGRCPGLAAPGGRRTESLPRSCSTSRCSPDMLHRFDPQSRESGFLRALGLGRWRLQHRAARRAGTSIATTERALFRGTVGEAAAVEFSGHF